MKIVRTLILIASLYVSATLAVAEEAAAPIEPEQTISPRVLGSQTFQIDLGLLIPLFSEASDGSSTPGANLTLGGAGRLKWGAFLNSSLALGVDVAGAIAGGPNTANNGVIFGMVNIGPHITNFFRLGNFEFPLSFSPSFTLLNYGSHTYAGFGLRPGIGIYYDATPSWSFGLNVQYWWVPEIYADSTGLSGQNRFGNILEVSLSALYSF